MPIIIDKNNVIIAGHTRLKASIKLGLKEVPVIRADDLTEEQAKAFRIADNKTNEFAEWDMDKLKAELGTLDDMFTGFDLDELDEIRWFDGDLDEDDFVFEIPEEPTSKLGQLYQLGEHRVLVGSSTDADSVERLMDFELADLVVTDPPYNVDYVGKTKDALTIENDAMEDGQFVQFLTDTFYAMSNSLKPGGAYYIWHSDSNRLAFSTALLANGLKERQNLIWVKNTMVMGRQDYQWKHEPCLYGWKPGSAHYFINDFTNTTVLEDKPNINVMNADELKAYAKVLQQEIDAGSTIIRDDKPSRSALHPTMKPVSLMANQVINSSKRNEKVLDLFGGSGSVLMACEELGRKCYTMELEPKYVDVIITRWENHTGKKAVLLD